MISKLVQARSFYHTCRYICQKTGAVILATEGVREHDYKLMAEDFLRQQRSRTGKTMACFHSILSFHPNEKPSDKIIQEIAEKYLRQLGIVNTQYAITKHTDRAHLHLHVVANMVNNDAKSIPDNWIGLKGKKAAQQLTEEYKLVPAIRKNMALTNVQSMNKLEKVKYKIYQAISENLSKSENMGDLEAKLLNKGIEMQFKYKGKTDEVQGVSFRMDNICFKGSSIDRQFSFAGLQSSFQKQQQYKLNHEAENTTIPQTRNSSQTADRYQENKTTGKLQPVFAQNLEEAIDLLMKPEYVAEQTPNELLKKKKKQKRFRRSI